MMVGAAAIAVIVVLKKQRSGLDLDHMQSDSCLNPYNLLLDIISPCPFTPFDDSCPTPFHGRNDDIVFVASGMSPS
jgi:hypothetical protein